MDGFLIYDFRIDGWSPETLPLARLGEYLAQLARLFGSPDDVHLMKVRRGSAIPELAVALHVQEQVAARLALAASPAAPDDVARAFKTLNGLLRDDGASAVLRVKGGAKVLRFPGRDASLAEEVVVFEPGDLDGVVMRVGGKDSTVPVWLEGEGGVALVCNAPRSIAKELAQRLFGEPVRVSGVGKWRRDADRQWQLEKFDIKSWAELDATSLADSIHKVREAEGFGWSEFEDPQAEWRRLRGQD